MHNLFQGPILVSVELSDQSLIRLPSRRWIGVSRYESHFQTEKSGNHTMVPKNSFSRKIGFILDLSVQEREKHLNVSTPSR